MASKVVWLTIRQIAAKYSKSECWVRRAIKAGKVSARLEDIGNGVSRWIVKESDAEAFFSGSRRGREDGRRKMIVYAAPGDEIRALRDLAVKFEGMEVSFAYKPS